MGVNPKQAVSHEIKSSGTQHCWHIWFFSIAIHSFYKHLYNMLSIMLNTLLEIGNMTMNNTQSQIVACLFRREFKKKVVVSVRQVINNIKWKNSG